MRFPTRTTRTVFRGALAAAVFSMLYLTACSDTSTLPLQSSAPQVESATQSSDIVFLEYDEPAGKRSRGALAAGRAWKAWRSDTEVVTPEEGGELVLRNYATGKTTFWVPPGAVDEPVTITMKYHTIGRVMVDLDFEPSGLHFNKAAILTLSYEGARYERRIDRKLRKGKIEGLTLYQFVERGERGKSGKWVEVPGAVWDPDAKTVSGPIWHFSRYAIGSNG